MLAAVAAALGFFTFIYDRIEWRSHVRVAVYFQATAGLREGAAFIVAGRPVGRVEAIALAGDRGIRVTVALETDAARSIEYGGDVFISSHGLLSAKYLEIGPAPVTSRSLRDGDEIVGHEPPSLDRAWQHTWDNLVTTARFAAAVRPEAAALRSEVDRLQATLAELAPTPLRAELAALRVEARHTRAMLDLDLPDTGETIGQLRTTIAGLGASADTLLLGVHGMRDRLAGRDLTGIERAVDRVRHALRGADALLAQVETIEATFANGSLAKLMLDPEFPEDTKALGKILKRKPWRILARPPDQR